jgi:preprotein translocase subunit SecG
MFTFGAVIRSLLIVVEIISSLLLVGAILIQRTRSQGMGMAFGAGMGESLFGGQVGNVLTRATVVVGIVFLVNTSALAILYAHTQTEEASVVDKVPVAAPAAMPAPDGAVSPAALAETAPISAPVEASVPVEAPAGSEPVAIPAAEVPAAQPEAAAPAAPAPEAP